MTTKSRYFEKPSLDRIKKCLEELKEHCVESNITELHMPKIGSGLDKVNFEDIRKEISEIFEKTNVKIVIHERIREANLQDDSNIAVQIDENEIDDDQTVHSDAENDVNNVQIGRASCRERV